MTTTLAPTVARIPGPARPAARSATRASVRRPTPAVYRRRRAVVGGLLATAFAIGVTVGDDVLTGSGGVPASAAESRSTLDRLTIIARPGDTLWTIAETHRGDIPISRYVDALVTLNGGASIQAGQAVTLP